MPRGNEIGDGMLTALGPDRAAWAYRQRSLLDAVTGLEALRAFTCGSAYASKREHVVLLPVNGYLPPQGSAGYPMLLMAADYVAQSPAAAEDLERIVVAVYEHRYGIAPSDPVVMRTLRLSGVSHAG